MQLMSIARSAPVLLCGVLSACGGGSSTTITSDLPEVVCTKPLDGAILNQAPGQISVSGTVSAIEGVDTLTVNGAPVAFDSTGAFTTPIDAVWGTNFVDFDVIDKKGYENHQSCAFLLSDSWAPDTQLLPSTITLRAAQTAVDDSSRSGNINSLADVMDAALNSNGVVNLIDSDLKSANPLYPDTCQQYGVLGNCLFDVQVSYLGMQVSGPNSISLTLVDGGFESTSVIRNATINLHVTGSASGVTFDTTGTVSLDTATATAVLNASLSQGQTDFSIRPGSVSISAGTISTNFSGLSGAILDTVTSLFNATVTSSLTQTLSDGITQFINSSLANAMSDLSIHNLATTFVVSRLDGTGTINVNFASGISTVNMNTSRMLTSFGTQFQAASAQQTDTLGAPIPSGNRLLDFTTTAPFASAVHTGLLDQALYALWRSGYFNATFTGGDLNGAVPAGVTLKIDASLPPTVSLREDGRIEIAMGALNMTLTNPAQFATTISGTIGGRVSCSDSLQGQNLLLENCTLDEKHISIGQAFLVGPSSIELENIFGSVLTSLFSEVVDNAIPVMPIPSYVLPEVVTNYGLPAGAELGLYNPVLDYQEQDVLLEGTLGLQ
jgi:hypothetical protein